MFRLIFEPFSTTSMQLLMFPLIKISLNKLYIMTNMRVLPNEIKWNVFISYCAPGYSGTNLRRNCELLLKLRSHWWPRFSRLNNVFCGKIYEHEPRFQVTGWLIEEVSQEQIIRCSICHMQKQFSRRGDKRLSLKCVTALPVQGLESAD